VKIQRGDVMLGFHPYFWHSSQPGRQSCQLYAPAAIYPQRNALVLVSVRRWVWPRAIECGQNEYVTSTFPKTLQEIEPGTHRLVAQTLNQLRTISWKYPLHFIFHPSDVWSQVTLLLRPLTWHRYKHQAVACTTNWTARHWTPPSVCLLLPHAADIPGSLLFLSNPETRWPCIACTHFLSSTETNFLAKHPFTRGTPENVNAFFSPFS
jgi:hypothetical protein